MGAAFINFVRQLEILKVLIVQLGEILNDVFRNGPYEQGAKAGPSLSFSGPIGDLADFFLLAANGTG